MATIAQYIRARAGDPRVGLRFDDEQWTWAEYVQACAERAALLEELRRPGPYHVGVLMDNTPEFSLWLGAAALVGAVVVGINPTRRGAELALDITGFFDRTSTQRRQREGGARLAQASPDAQ